MQQKNNWQTFIVPIAIFFIAVGILVYNMQNSGNNLKLLEEEYQKAIQQEDFGQAIKILCNILKKQPENYSTRYQLIRLYLAQNNAIHAQEQLDICFEKFGQLPELLELKGGIFQLQGKLEEAEKVYIEILEAYPEFLYAKIDLFLLEFQKKNWTKATEYLTNLETEHKNELKMIPFLFQHAYNYYMIQGEYDKALIYLKYILQRQTMNFVAQKNCIEILAIQSKLSFARNMYKEMWTNATSVQKNFFLFLYAKTLPILENIKILQDNVATAHPQEKNLFQMELLPLLTQVGKYQEALNICQDIEATTQNEMEQKGMWMAHLYYLSGDYQTAKSITESWIPFATRLIQTFALIHIHLQAHEYDIVRNMIAELKQRDLDVDGSYNVLFLECRTEYEAGNFGKAMEIAKSIYNDAPSGLVSYAQTAMLLGSMKFNQKKYEEAREIFQKLIKNPQRAPEYRIKAALWDGIVAYFQDKTQETVWTEHNKIQWDETITNTVWIKLLASLSNQKITQDIQDDNKQQQDDNKQETDITPWLHNKLIANDIYYILGIQQEIQGNFEQAHTYYTNGLHSTIGHEFPYHELQLAQQRIQGK
ncbi:MAG TPA: tetratricopeptide repeat protein [Planctomycetota bacterium]|nr:tetratricopeptide repeat protein [Planctomycetota bacterium]